jgi:hypothetical protein
MFYGWFTKAVDFVQHKYRLLLGIIIFLIIIAGGVYSFWLGEQLRFLPDEREHYSLANNLYSLRIYSFDGVQPTAYKPPGYPIFLAVTTVISNRVEYYRFLNFVLLGITVYILFKILEERYSQLTGILGVLLILFYPVLFFTGGTLYPQTLASLLFLASIYFLSKDKIRTRDFIFGGLFLGFLILTVPTFIFLVVILLGWFWLRHRDRLLKGYGFTLVVAFLLVGMWTTRNYLIYDSFVLISTNFGDNFIRGNSENTLPNSGPNVDISMYTSEIKGMDEIEVDKYLRAKAFEYIREHPDRSIKLYLLKALNYFNFRNNLVTSSEASQLRDLLMLLTYGPLLILFILRLFLVMRFKPGPFEILLITIYIINALYSAIFFTRIRYRLPFDLLLIMIVAIFSEKLITSFLHKYKENCEESAII